MCDVSLARRAQNGIHRADRVRVGGRAEGMRGTLVQVDSQRELKLFAQDFAVDLLEWKTLSALLMDQHALPIRFDEQKMLWPIEIATAQPLTFRITCRHALDDELVRSRECIVRKRHTAGVKRRVHRAQKLCARLS